MKRIKTGDTVMVIAGKSKGVLGKVKRVFDGRVIIEGANLIKKHVKANPRLNQKGGIIEREAFLDVSNVAMYNSATSKVDKVGFKFVDKDGKQHKIRYFKSTGDLVDSV
jgi:large subunit ribosomal protein L24